VAVLDHRFWERHLGGDGAILGRTIWVNQHAVTVVGVAPASFTGLTIGLEPPAIYFPLTAAPLLATDTDVRVDRFGRMQTGPGGNEGFAPSPVSPLASFSVVARIPGTDHVGARRGAFAARLAGGWEVVSLSDTLLPIESQHDVRQFLALVTAAVGLTFLLGCANVAGLLLARGDERRAEFGVRAALGAGRSRLVADLFAETAVMISVGAIAALLVARMILSAISTYVLPGNIALAALPVGFAPRGWAVALTSAALAACIVAVWPAFRSTDAPFLRDLRGRSSPHLASSRLLVAAQVTLCVVLVFGATLFIRTVSNALAIDVGFQTDGLMSAELGVPLAARRDPAELVARIEKLEQLVDSVRSIPGVLGASTGPLPLVASVEGSFSAAAIDGVPAKLTAPLDVVYTSPGYFGTLMQEVIAGRDFRTDDQGQPRPVAVVNETAARQLVPEGRAVGHALALGRQLGGRTVMQPPSTVIGIVRDAKLATLREIGRPIVYLSRIQNRFYLAGYMSGIGSARLLVRWSHNTNDLRAILADPVAGAGFQLRGLTSLKERVDDLLMPQRLGRLLLSALAGLALILTAVGVYGLVSCLVVRTRKEIGIRVALGADPVQISSAIAKWVSWPLFSGLGIGLVLSCLVGRVADRFMYGMRGTDPSTLVFTVSVIVASAAIALLPPMWAAMRIDPNAALREE
jgi:predicted permease